MEDPLNIDMDLTGVETTIPTMKSEDVKLQCAESAIQPNKDRTGHNWHLKFVTTDTLTAVDGREIKPGFPLYLDVALQARDDATDPKGFERGLSSAIDALFGSTKANRPRFNNELVGAAKGKIVTGTVYADEWPKGSGQFNNKVRRIKALTEAQK